MTPEDKLALAQQAADDARDAHILETVTKMRAVLDELEAAIVEKHTVVLLEAEATP